MQSTVSKMYREEPEMQIDKYEDENDSKWGNK